MLRGQTGMADVRMEKGLRTGSEMGIPPARAPKTSLTPPLRAREGALDRTDIHRASPRTARTGTTGFGSRCGLSARVM
jgi:hypothetical protein